MTFETIADADLLLDQDLTIIFDDYSYTLDDNLATLVSLSYSAELADTSSLPSFIVFDGSGKTFTITPTTAD